MVLPCCGSQASITSKRAALAARRLAETQHAGFALRASVHPLDSVIPFPARTLGPEFTMFAPSVVTLLTSVHWIDRSSREITKAMEIAFVIYGFTLCCIHARRCIERCETLANISRPNIWQVAFGSRSFQMSSDYILNDSLPIFGRQ